MGAASSVKPAAVGPASSDTAADFPAKSRLYGFSDGITEGESWVEEGSRFVPSRRPDGVMAATQFGPNAGAIMNQVTSSSDSTPAPLAVEAAEISKKLQLINAAAVNGDKSLLLKLLDGDFRMLLMQNEFGR